MMQKYAVQSMKFTDEQIKIGDIDGDGKVTLKDAVLAQKIALKFS